MTHSASKVRALSFINALPGPASTGSHVPEGVEFLPCRGRESSSGEGAHLCVKSVMSPQPYVLFIPRIL